MGHNPRFLACLWVTKIHKENECELAGSMSVLGPRSWALTQTYVCAHEDQICLPLEAVDED